MANQPVGDLEVIDQILVTGVAFAQEAAAGKQPSTLEMAVPFILMAVFMYFILLRPQSKKAKEHQQLISNLKAGDEVVTSGGIIGRVKSVAENFVTIDAGSTSLKVMKSHVTGLTKPKEAVVQK